MRDWFETEWIHKKTGWPIIIKKQIICPKFWGAYIVKVNEKKGVVLSEFKGIPLCESEDEIWDLLENYKGHAIVKDKPF